MMTDTHQVAYQDFVYKHFEWAVIVNALKWRLMEWTKVKSYWILSVHCIGYKRYLKNTEFLLSDCSKYIKNEDKQQSVYCLPLDIIFFLLPK